MKCICVRDTPDCNGTMGAWYGSLLVFIHRPMSQCCTPRVEIVSCTLASMVASVRAYVDQPPVHASRQGSNQCSTCVYSHASVSMLCEQTQRSTQTIVVVVCIHHMVVTHGPGLHQMARTRHSSSFSIDSSPCCIRHGLGMVTGGVGN